MNALTLLRDLQSRGFDLRPEGENIRIVPFDQLTETDCTEIRAHKFDLLALMQRSEDPFFPRHAYDAVAARAFAMTQPQRVQANLVAYADMAASELLIPNTIIEIQGAAE